MSASDNKKLEELEAKLLALSDAVESLEISTEVDPFEREDQRRMLDNFREAELAFTQDSQSSENSVSSSEEPEDFIQVIPEGGGDNFKAHWISIDQSTSYSSCSEVKEISDANVVFREALSSKIASQDTVSSGDIFILLCQDANTESSESESESETDTQFCRYVGLVTKISLSQESEPDPNPADSATKLSTSSNGYEILVWSSCECPEGSSDLEPELSNLVPASDSSSSGVSFLSKGSAQSNLTVDLPEAVTSVSLSTIDWSSVENNPFSATSLTGIGKTDKLAGYLFELKELSQQYKKHTLGYKKDSFNLEANRSSLIQTDYDKLEYELKNIRLLDKGCGLEVVSIASASLDLFKASLSSSNGSHTYLNGLQHVSLGVSIASSTLDPINEWKVLNSAYQNDELISEKKAYIPAIAEDDANAISLSNSITENLFSLTSANVSVAEVSLGRLFTVSIAATQTSEVYNFSSGLLIKSESLETEGSSVKFDFTVPNPAEYNSTVKVVQNPRVEVYGGYDNIYQDSSTGKQVGDAYYYVKLLWDECLTEFSDGTFVVKGSCEQKSSEDGPIIVKSTEVRYGCGEFGYCVPDPSGDYEDSNCGSSCSTGGRFLSVRPPKIHELRWTHQCEEIDVYYRNPAASDFSNQGYINTSGFSKVLEADDGLPRFGADALDEFSGASLQTPHPFYSSSGC